MCICVNCVLLYSLSPRGSAFPGARVPGRRDRCLPKWYGRGIPERYAGLPLEGGVCHPGRPIILLISLNNSFNDSIIVSMVHK